MFLGSGAVGHPFDRYIRYEISRYYCVECRPSEQEFFVPARTDLAVELL